jgi:S-disulfanyl-L-cysteine oxidoreductase SoxD
MRWRVVIAGLVMAQLSMVGLIAGQDAGKSVWDGVYTKDQAAKGEAVYTEKCVNCHGVGGAGNDAPPLNDAGFAANWDTLTLDDLFKRIKDTMPITAAGSLTREESVSILAYLLQFNRFPEGTDVLPDQSMALGGIRYVVNKPIK